MGWGGGGGGGDFPNHGKIKQWIPCGNRINYATPDTIITHDPIPMQPWSDILLHGPYPRTGLGTIPKREPLLKSAPFHPQKKTAPTVT